MLSKVNLPKNENTGFFRAIGYGIKTYIDTEKSPEGRFNFAVGLVLSGLFILTCIPTMAMYIIKFFYPKCDILIPWYGVFVFFIVVAGYFIHCGNSVMKIVALRNAAKAE